MKNIDPKFIEKIGSEALDLHRKIASDNKRLLDLKKQISEASVGRNSSYKIPLDKGTVKINMVKESLSNKIKFKSSSRTINRNWLGSRKYKIIKL